MIYAYIGLKWLKPLGIRKKQPRRGGIFYKRRKKWIGTPAG
jgi:hypothetical protein